MKKTILDLKLESGDLGEVTFRSYFKELLKNLWNEGEGFSGKRPFGNSGWEHDLYLGLVKNKVIPGEFDDDGYLVSYDKTAGDEVIFEAIENL